MWFRRWKAGDRAKKASAGGYTGSAPQGCRHGAKCLLKEVREEVVKRLELIWADGSNRGELIAWIEDCFGWKLEIVEKPKDQTGFRILAKLWIVERTIAWLVRQRRWPEITHACQKQVKLSSMPR